MFCFVCIFHNQKMHFYLINYIDGGCIIWIRFEPTWPNLHLFFFPLERRRIIIRGVVKNLKIGHCKRALAKGGINNKGI